MKAVRRLLLAATVAASGVSVATASSSVFAAEAPAPANEIAMSAAVRNSLNEIIALMDMQKLDEASVAMQQMRAMSLQIPMTDYEKLVMLQTSGQLLMVRQKYEDAVTEYEAILQLETLSPADRTTTLNLAGQLYLQVGDWNKGLEHLLALNELQAGSNMETLFRIAFSYYQLGQAEAAIPYMEQALVVGGDQAGEFYYKNMGVMYTAAGKPAQAIESFEKLLNIAPNSPERETVSSDLAALYIRVGDTARAEVALEALIRDFPDSAKLPVWQQSLSALRSTRR